MCHHKWYDSLHSQRPPNWQPLFSPYTPTYPTRPTVSSNGTSTEKVSRHVDYSHKPLTPGFHCTSGTPTSSTNSRSYPHYQLLACPPFLHNLPSNNILIEKIYIGETSGSALQHFWSLSGRHDNQGYSEAVEG